MQFEFNSKICRNAVCDIQTIENRIRYQLDRLTQIYNMYRISEDRSERELAKKMHKEMVSLEQEIRDVAVMRKSLDKLTSIYESNEKQVAQMFDYRNIKFNPPAILPGPVKPIFITVPPPKFLFVLFKKEN